MVLMDVSIVKAIQAPFLSLMDIQCNIYTTVLTNYHSTNAIEFDSVIHKGGLASKEGEC